MHFNLSDCFVFDLTQWHEELKGRWKDHKGIRRQVQSEDTTIKIRNKENKDREKSAKSLLIGWDVSLGVHQKTISIFSTKCLPVDWKLTKVNPKFATKY